MALGERADRLRFVIRERDGRYPPLDGVFAGACEQRGGSEGLIFTYVDRDPYGSCMGIQDWVQAGSLVIVAAALIVNAVQLRHSSRQTLLLARTIEDNVHGARASSVFQLSAMMLDHTDVLRWHLRARGYPDWAVTDERTLFAVLRLQTHESTHLSADATRQDPATQMAWLITLRADLSNGFYQSLWPWIRQFYAPAFAALVDRMVAVESTTRQRQPPVRRTLQPSSAPTGTVAFRSSVSAPAENFDRR